jgi:uncharacterized paraquat-inducible protein A
MKGTKREAATMIRELLRASLHNEFCHDTDAQAKKCERCKLHVRAKRLTDKLDAEIES